MAKTSLDPTTVGQLKKLFIENDDGKNILLKSGKVKLAGGKAVVNLPIKFDSFMPFVMPIGTSAGAYYVADVSEKYQFTIVSSSSSDDAEVFWIALGG
jgi:hypothetical protein